MLLGERHDRADHDRGDTAADEHEPELVLGVAHSCRSLEDGPVQAGGAVEPELDHDPGEQHTDRRGGDGVGVGQPEVERNDGRLDEEAAQQQREG